MDKLELRSYTITEFSKIAKISRETAYKWINEGKLKTIEIPNGQKRIPYEVVARYIGG